MSSETPESDSLLEISLSEDLRAKLSAIAERRRLPLEGLVRSALEEFVYRHGSSQSAYDTAVFYKHAEDELRQMVRDDTRPPRPSQDS